MAGSAMKSRVRNARPDAALIAPRARNEDRPPQWGAISRSGSNPPAGLEL